MESVDQKLHDLMLQPSGTNDGKGATLKMPERHVQALQVGDHGDGSSIRYVHAEDGGRRTERQQPVAQEQHLSLDHNRSFLRPSYQPHSRSNRRKRGCSVVPSPVVGCPASTPNGLGN